MLYLIVILLCIALQGSTKLFCTVAESFYNPSRMHKISNFLTSTPIFISPFKIMATLMWMWSGISGLWFLTFLISLMANDVEIFPYAHWLFAYAPWSNVHPSALGIFKSKVVYFFSGCWVIEFFLYSGYELIKYMLSKHFLSLWELPFHSLDNVI